ncbi:single-stranded DNA-binding protein [Ruania zhangjianzhongii]|uniref:single-stranded DNA-binding protein n=1 Tax=Ruania zhangjianzhongii TaxID=2603206 RepID=UPI0011CCD310
MYDTELTVAGNLTADPDLRFAPSGAASARFTLASTPRVFDSRTGRWADGETLFIRCVAWRDLAENAGESLSKGVRVLARGRLRQREYETSAGERRQVVELEVDECGPSLRFATTSVSRSRRNPSTLSSEWSSNGDQ